MLMPMPRSPPWLVAIPKARISRRRRLATKLMHLRIARVQPRTCLSHSRRLATKLMQLGIAPLRLREVKPYRMMRSMAPCCYPRLMILEILMYMVQFKLPRKRRKPLHIILILVLRTLRIWLLLLLQQRATTMHSVCFRRSRLVHRMTRFSILMVRSGSRRRLTITAALLLLQPVRIQLSSLHLTTHLKASNDMVLRLYPM